ncbi:DUF7405 family protein [Natronorarus salvus]|uniref:DUF7405 family protein n=1 Tax=Natronorarus salvus TaxID=3117733 RepID=UPI002F261109
MTERAGLTRRGYARALVAAGGSGALSACLDEFGEREIPGGVEQRADLPERQHAWNAVCEVDDDGNVRTPRHHVLLSLALDREGEPTAEDRRLLEEALETLERAYEWSTEGLLFTVGYVPGYFERFGEGPSGVDLPQPTALTDFEEPEFDAGDLLLHLTSDHEQAVLEAESALIEGHDEANGVEMERGLEEAFSVDLRRSGFVGEGLPAGKQGDDEVRGIPTSEPIPEEAPFFMGFRSGFRESQASEDRVTIEEGPFAGGTTEHLSSMTLQLDVWYEQDTHAQRVAKLFSAEHAREDTVGEYGESLSDSSGLTDERIAATAEDARTEGIVGHAQKAARAREDGEPLLLRRDFNTVDDGRPGLHFLALQREIEEFVRVRDAMTGADLAGGGVGQTLNNGILQYLFVNRRGNFLVPPRSRRALPTPEGEG